MSSVHLHVTPRVRIAVLAALALSAVTLGALAALWGSPWLLAPALFVAAAGVFLAGRPVGGATASAVVEPEPPEERTPTPVRRRMAEFRDEAVPELVDVPGVGRVVARVSPYFPDVRAAYHPGEPETVRATAARPAPILPPSRPPPPRAGRRAAKAIRRWLLSG